MSQTIADDQFNYPIADGIVYRSVRHPKEYCCAFPADGVHGFLGLHSVLICEASSNPQGGFRPRYLVECRANGDAAEYQIASDHVVGQLFPELSKVLATSP